LTLGPFTATLSYSLIEGPPGTGPTARSVHWERVREPGDRAGATELAAAVRSPGPFVMGLVTRTRRSEMPFAEDGSIRSVDLCPGRFEHETFRRVVRRSRAGHRGGIVTALMPRRPALRSFSETPRVNWPGPGSRTRYRKSQLRDRPGFHQQVEDRWRGPRARSGFGLDAEGCGKAAGETHFLWRKNSQYKRCRVTAAATWKKSGPGELVACMGVQETSARSVCQCAGCGAGRIFLRA